MKSHEANVRIFFILWSLIENPARLMNNSAHSKSSPWARGSTSVLHNDEQTKLQGGRP